MYCFQGVCVLGMGEEKAQLGFGTWLKTGHTAGHGWVLKAWLGAEDTARYGTHGSGWVWGAWLDMDWY